MAKYKMLVNANFDQLRVGIVAENGLLEQVDFESLNHTSNLGNIYIGTVTAIEPSLQASFVDYGGNRHGFLPFNEMHYRYFQNPDRRAPVQERLKIGQKVIVQVAREEIGLKGAYLTTYLSLPGQYLVMMPLTSKVGISRKIEDQEDRKALREILEVITVPDGMGYIIRTAGLGKSREQLQRDLNLLTTTWAELESRSEGVKSPSLLYQEDDVVTRTIRDYFNEDVKEILVDDHEVFGTVKKYFKKMMPSYAHMVKHYRAKTPLFTKFHLDDQVESIFSSKILLPSGGSIVIEQTEALVVIDVNSGKTSEGNLEATAFKTNTEAAEAIARQLRLRDLGGLVVIDFIDLKEKRHTHDVEQRLRDCLKKDKARITLTGMSRFGLLEMSRQRINTSKQNRHLVECPTCNGLGRVQALETQCLDLLRRIKLQVRNKPIKELTIHCGPELGIGMLNDRRSELSTLEREFNVKIRVNIKQDFSGVPNFETVKRSKEEEKEDMAMPAPLSLSTMAASMSEKAINEQKDYREEKLEALEKLTFEELRSVDIPIPQKLTPFERFNFSVRVTLMKHHGLYEDKMEDFKVAIKDSLQKGNPIQKTTADEGAKPDEAKGGGKQPSGRKPRNVSRRKPPSKPAKDQADKDASKTDSAKAGDNPAQSQDATPPADTPKQPARSSAKKSTASRGRRPKKESKESKAPIVETE